MNKRELAENVLKKVPYLRKKDIELVIEESLKAIENALLQGERVTLTGFGSWATRLTASKKVLNPLTKESFILGPRTKIKWTTAGRIADSLNKKEI